MIWLFIAIIAYFINAGVYVADKFLLSKKFHSSITYAFYVGIWSIFNLFLLAFDPWLPSLHELAIDLLAGLLFVFTLVFWYKALHQSEATRVVPIVGALTPIFSFILSFVFLGEDFDAKQFLVFVILVAGGALISVKRTKIYFWSSLSNRLREVFDNVLGGIHASYRPARRLLVNSIISALFFAGYYVLMKYIYLEQPFVGSFVWSRLGSFLGVLCFLLVPYYRDAIRGHQAHNKSPKNLFGFLVVRFLAAIAFIMLNWAISLGNVAMVNALQGVQFLFLMLIVLVMSAKFPRILREEAGRGILLQKITGIAMVSAGLYLLMMV
jgi:drug/metabolite transporter (DMT)-like permease